MRVRSLVPLTAAVSLISLAGCIVQAPTPTPIPASVPESPEWLIQWRDPVHVAWIQVEVTSVNRSAIPGVIARNSVYESRDLWNSEMNALEFHSASPAWLVQEGDIWVSVSEHRLSALGEIENHWRGLGTKDSSARVRLIDGTPMDFRATPGIASMYFGPYTFSRPFDVFADSPRVPGVNLSSELAWTRVLREIALREDGSLHDVAVVYNTTVRVDYHGIVEVRPSPAIQKIMDSGRILEIREREERRESFRTMGTDGLR